MITKFKSNRLTIGGLDNFLFGCFALWILIDSLNGFSIVNHLSLRPSRIFKLAVLGLVILRLIRHETLKKMSVFLLPYLVMVLINSYLYSNITETFVLLTKPLSTFLFFIYFKKIAETNVIYFERKFRAVFITSFIFFSLNILLGLMGYGYSVYNIGQGETIGVKGFLYAQNEISGMVIYLYPIMLTYIHTNYTRIIYYASCLFIMALSYSMGTKTGLAASVISCLVVTYYQSNKIGKNIVLALGVIAIVLAVIYIQALMSIEYDAIERFVYFYNKNGFVDAVTSNRLNYLEYISKQFFRMDCASQLLGWGDRDLVCEMDPMDAMFSFGYIGGISNVLFLLFLAASPFIIEVNNEKKIIVVSNVCLLFIAIFSGHIFFSSMAGLFIALANARLYIPNNSVRNGQI